MPPGVPQGSRSVPATFTSRTDPAASTASRAAGAGLWNTGDSQAGQHWTVGGSTGESAVPQRGQHSGTSLTMRRAMAEDG